MACGRHNILTTNTSDLRCTLNALPCWKIKPIKGLLLSNMLNIDLHRLNIDLYELNIGLYKLSTHLRQQTNTQKFQILHPITQDNSRTKLCLLLSNSFHSPCYNNAITKTPGMFLRWRTNPTSTWGRPFKSKCHNCLHCNCWYQLLIDTNAACASLTRIPSLHKQHNNSLWKLLTCVAKIPDLYKACHKIDHCGWFQRKVNSILPSNQGSV